MGGTFTDAGSWEKSINNKDKSEYDSIIARSSYKSKPLEGVTISGLVVNSGDINTRSNHVEVNVQGFRKIRLVGKHDRGISNVLYAFYSSSELSAATMVGKVVSTEKAYGYDDSTGEYEVMVNVPETAYMLAVNTTNGYSAVYGMDMIAYQLPDKVENIEAELDTVAVKSKHSSLVTSKRWSETFERVSGSVGDSGDLNTNFGHYKISVDGKTFVRVIGGMSHAINVFGAFYSDNEISKDTLLELLSFNDYVQDEQFDVTLKVPESAKLFVLNSIRTVTSQGLEKAWTYSDINYQLPDKVESMENVIAESPIYSFNLEDFMYRDSEITGGGFITWSYNVSGMEAILISGYKIGLEDGVGSISFYDADDSLIKQHDATEIEWKYFNVPSGAVRMEIYAYYTQRNTFFVYKAKKTGSTLQNHVQYNSDTMNIPDMVKGRNTLNELTEGVADGGYMCFSDKDDMELVHNTPCDTGQNISVNGNGMSVLGITNGHLNYEEKGKPNFYLLIKSKFGRPMNFMSCKFYKAGVVFLLGKEAWSDHMIHLICASPEELSDDEGMAVAAGLRNDDSGDFGIVGEYRLVYGENRIRKSDVRDDHIYEYIFYFAGEFIYVIKPDTKLFVLQNVSNDEYHKNAAILPEATSALWQNANLTEVCCGRGKMCNIAMRYAYNAKKMFG